MARTSLALSLLFALAACSNSGAVVETDLNQLPADISTDAAADIKSVPGDAVEDGTMADEETPDALPFDTTPPDTVGPACEAGEGCFLDECSENSECQSGWCVEHLGEGICTQQCQEECPQGWSCKPVGAGGPDLVYVCVSDFANLCKPCAQTADCESPGGAQDVCVSYGEEGSFCGGICSQDDDCPWGFGCVDAVTVDGIALKQCRAEAGVCPCSGKSVELALWTPCTQGSDWGTCQGKRICTEEGLTECDADLPGEETCNGMDDDCDGEVDEPATVGGDYVNLCHDDNDCTTDTCLGDQGCDYVLLDEGECKDGDACTVGDHCEAGECVGLPVACDDDNPCTDDACDGLGGCAATFNTASCDDGNPCTVNDTCQEGECVGYDLDCSCQTTADCEQFEDGDLCNGTLYCDTSSLPYQCKVDEATVISCPELEGQEAICAQLVCAPDTGDCSITAIHTGYACDDGDACTVGDHCAEAICQPGVIKFCDDGNGCTEDGCDAEQGCVHSPVDGACDDGNACTLNDQCTDGTCGSGILLDCDDGNTCTTDYCDPKVGCAHKLNTAPCDDGDVCTTGDHCHLGSCISSGSLNCDDGNSCTMDSCDVDAGCQFQHINGACDDGNPCTEGDHCAKGWCTFTQFKDCSDGQVCNGEETCDPAQGCIAGAAPVLDDGNACTLDFCDDSMGGIIHTPIDEECDNGAWCDGPEICDPQLGCLPGVPPVLDDGVTCTVDICDEATDTVKHLPDDAACADNDVCDGDDSCDVLLDCQAGTPLECDDGLVCTTDGCDPVDGCTYAPLDNGTPCVAAGKDGTCQDETCVPDCLAGSQTFNTTGAPQTFDLPVCAETVTIEVFGARGGDEQVGKGGNGARIKCVVQGVAGETLAIRVGEIGKQGVPDLAGGGGGGGSFVWVSGQNAPLAVAGGGGGASYQGHPGQPGLTTNQGGPGGYYSVPAGSGGFTDNGSGGGTGAGGGGWNSSGTSNNWADGGQLKGGAGGASDYTGNGGYGGGGGAFHGGGGGGGYSGGSGGKYTIGGGGGGSYCAGDQVEAESGANSGNGKIVISWE